MVLSKLLANQNKQIIESEVRGGWLFELLHCWCGLMVPINGSVFKASTCSCTHPSRGGNELKVNENIPIGSYTTKAQMSTGHEFHEQIPEQVLQLFQRISWIPRQLGVTAHGRIKLLNVTRKTGHDIWRLERIQTQSLRYGRRNWWPKFYRAPGSPALEHIYSGAGQISWLAWTASVLSSILVHSRLHLKIGRAMRSGGIGVGQYLLRCLSSDDHLSVRPLDTKDYRRIPTRLQPFC